MVTAKHTESGLTRTMTANENGDYRMPSLPLEAYEVTAEIFGFKPLILNCYDTSLSGRGWRVKHAG